MLPSVPLGKDLRELLESFRSEAVEFLVVGGHAVAVHGHPRLTEDLDLLVRPTLENAKKILLALEKFGFGGVGLTASDFTVPERMIQLGRTPNRVDLLTGIYGVSFDEAWAGRVSVELGGGRVEVIGCRELIRNKRSTARPQDLADAEALERGLGE